MIYITNQLLLNSVHVLVVREIHYYESSYHPHHHKSTAYSLHASFTFTLGDLRPWCGTVGAVGGQRWVEGGGAMLAGGRGKFGSEMGHVVTRLERKGELEGWETDRWEGSSGGKWRGGGETDGEIGGSSDVVSWGRDGGRGEAWSQEGTILRLCCCCVWEKEDEGQAEEKEVESREVTGGGVEGEEGPLWGNWVDGDTSAYGVKTHMWILKCNHGMSCSVCDLLNPRRDMEESTILIYIYIKKNNLVISILINKNISTSFHWVWDVSKKSCDQCWMEIRTQVYNAP